VLSISGRDERNPHHARRAVGSGAHGTLIQIVDPAEETFPYSGRVRIRRAGEAAASSPPAAPRAGQRLCRARGLHRDEIRSETNKLDWLFPTHTTSRSAAELLLFLHSGMMVSKGAVRTSTVKAGRSA